MTCCGSVTVTNSNCSVVLQLTSTRVVDVIAEGPVGPTGAAGAAGAPGAAGPPKSLTIASPVTGDEFTLFSTLATVSTAITNTTTGQLLTVQNMPIPVDQFFWVKITAVSGTVAEVNVSVKV